MMAGPPTAPPGADGCDQIDNRLHPAGSADHRLTHDTLPGDGLTNDGPAVADHRLADRRLITIEAGAAGRLDRMLAAACPDLSRSRLKALIAGGAVVLTAPDTDGRTVDDPSAKVKPGQVFALTVPAPVSPLPRPQAIPLDIVHEDDHIVVVNKPPGMVVHPAAGAPAGTLVNALLAHCGASLSGIGGVCRPGIVHRIDKDTSGLLVVAKSDAAHAGLARQFAAHDLERTYQAVVWGLPAPAADRIEGAIGRSPHDRKKMAMVARGGKPAVTDYTVEAAATAGAAALLSCRLQTGRTHQIRVHLTGRGHPLIGDPVYGHASRPRLAALAPDAAAAVAGFGRQALHAALLGIRHPIDGRPMRFTRPPPPDMAALIRLLFDAVFST